MSATIAGAVLRSKSGLKTSSSSDPWPLDHEATDSILILTIDSGISASVINLIFSARISKTQDADDLSRSSNDHAFVQSFVWVFTGFFSRNIKYLLFSFPTKKNVDDVDTTAVTKNKLFPFFSAWELDHRRRAVVMWQKSTTQHCKSLCTKAFY